MATEAELDLTPPTVELSLYGEHDDQLVIYRRVDGVTASLAGWTTPRAYWARERGGSSVVEFTAEIEDDAVVVSITAAMKDDLPKLGFWECRALTPEGKKYVFADGPCRFTHEVSS